MATTGVHFQYPSNTQPHSLHSDRQSGPKERQASEPSTHMISAGAGKPRRPLNHVGPTAYSIHQPLSINATTFAPSYPPHHQLEATIFQLEASLLRLSRLLMKTKEEANAHISRLTEERNLERHHREAAEAKLQACSSELNQERQLRLIAEKRLMDQMRQPQLPGINDWYQPAYTPMQTSYRSSRAHSESLPFENTRVTSSTKRLSHRHRAQSEGSAFKATEERRIVFIQEDPSVDYILTRSQTTNAQRASEGSTSTSSKNKNNRKRK